MPLWLLNLYFDSNLYKCIENERNYFEIRQHPG